MITFSANNNDFYSGWNKTIERYNSAEGKKDFNERSRKLTDRANLLRQRRDAKFAANKAEGDILVKNSGEQAPVDAASKKGAKVSFGAGLFAEADRLSLDKSPIERNRIIRAKRDKQKNEKAAALQSKFVDAKEAKSLREGTVPSAEALKEPTPRKNRPQHVKMNFDPNAKRISGYPAYAKDVAPLRRGALSETVFENGFNPENMKKVPSTEDYVKSACQIPRQVAEALNDCKYNTTEVDVIIHRNLPGDGHFTMSPVKPEYIEKNAQECIEPAPALKSSYVVSRNSSSMRAPSTAEMPAEPVAESVKTSAEALPKNSSVIPGYEKVAKAGEVEWIISKDGTLSPKTKNIPGLGECLISKTNLLTVDRLTAKIVELCKKTPDAAAQILADFQKVLERCDTTKFQIDLLLQKFLKELAHSDTHVSEKSLNKKASIFAKNVNPNLKANALKFVENARKVVR